MNNELNNAMLKHMMETLEERRLIYEGLKVFIETLEKTSSDKNKLRSIPLYNVICLLTDIAHTNLDYKMMGLLNQGFIEGAKNLLLGNYPEDTEVKKINIEKPSDIQDVIESLKDEDGFNGLKDLL